MQNNLHKDFKLNGFSFTSVDEILSYSKDFSEEIYQFLQDWFSKKEYVIVQTSGSTGTPKDIQLLKQKMINSALATGQFFNLKPKTTALMCLPSKYIAGKMMLVRALTLGWHIDIVSSNASPLKTISKKYDFSAMVPLQVENSLDKIHLLETLIIGGGVVSKKLQDKLQSISTNVFATYGMTETITHIAIKKLNHFKGAISNSVTIAYYKTLPNTTIYIDQRNCLVLKNNNVANEIVFTNDVVQLISDTQFEWLGRIDNVINSGGIKLYPEKIEEQLSTLIKQRFFVTGIEDELLGNKLILVVEAPIDHQLYKNKLFSEIQNLRTLSKFEIPKEIYFMDQFIETGTKKIQRNKTLELLKR
ncbi:AMP-binding protein [uncultured Polaribacter sp.]|uniref:AMP-binding protein n=1 Tax=uncultured Polaribacter sp. TaxID=174711 RepID=UPI00345C5823